MEVIAPRGVAYAATSDSARVCKDSRTRQCSRGDRNLIEITLLTKQKWAVPRTPSSPSSTIR